MFELMNLLFLILSCVVAYFIGSISPSIIISRAKGIDIKQNGSGNAGTTNSIRVLGKKFGAIIFLLDFVKGFLVVFIVGVLFGSLTSYFAGIFVILGHVFSIFHHFKAGKGVATGIGVLFAVYWLFGLICLVIGIVLIVISRRVSIGSLIGSIAIPVVA